MKEQSEKWKNTYKYYCDVCKKEVSYKNDTLKQIHLKYKDNRTKKLYDLCDKCYEKLIEKLSRR